MFHGSGVGVTIAQNSEDGEDGTHATTCAAARPSSTPAKLSATTTTGIRKPTPNASARRMTNDRYSRNGRQVRDVVAA